MSACHPCLGPLLACAAVRSLSETSLACLKASCRKVPSSFGVPRVMPWCLVLAVFVSSFVVFGCQGLPCSAGLPILPHEGTLTCPAEAWTDRFNTIPLRKQWKFGQGPKKCTTHNYNSTMQMFAFAGCGFFTPFSCNLCAQLARRRP